MDGSGIGCNPGGREGGSLGSRILRQGYIRLAGKGLPNSLLELAANPELRHPRRGALSADKCKHRLDELTRSRKALEEQHAELEAQIAETTAPPTDEELAALATQAATIIRNANPRHTKTLLQALVERIDVESRTSIQPVFYVPAVRPPDGSVPPARIELAHAV